MSVVLSFSRCRAKNYGLLRLVWIFCALCLGFNIKPYIRWVASEVNSADEPSRLENDDKIKNLIAQLSHIVDVALPSSGSGTCTFLCDDAEPSREFDMHGSTSLAGARSDKSAHRPSLDGELIRDPPADPSAERY